MWQTEEEEEEDQERGREGNAIKWLEGRGKMLWYNLNVEIP